MVYVMSDIHGNKAAFYSILKQINLKENDTLYILGDVIDRHEYGVDILRQIMTMKNEKCLLGNHELMCLNAIVPHKENLPWIRDDPDHDLRQWLRNGGGTTLRNLQKLDESDLQQIVSYLIRLPYQSKIEIDGKKYILVHASPKELYPTDGSSRYPDETNYCVWNRISNISKLPNDCTVVFGHTPTNEYRDDGLLRIWHTHKAIGIDCGSGFDIIGEPYQGSLACLCLDDLEEYYSSV